MSILLDDGAGVVGRYALANLLAAGESLRPLLGTATLPGGTADALILEGPLLSDAAEIRFFGRGGMSGYSADRDGALDVFLSSRGVLPERQAAEAARRFEERLQRWREF